MKVEVKMTGLEGVLDTLKSLPPEVVSKKGGPARAALRKGAMVIVKEAKKNFAAAVAQPGKSGVTESTGFTEKNIIAMRKIPLGGVKGERYIVTVAGKPHPSGHEYTRKSRRKADSKRKVRSRKARQLMANDVAFMMEYGTSNQAATPWLRPAFAAKASEAIYTVERELIKGIDRVVKKLAAQNKGKR